MSRDLNKTWNNKAKKVLLGKKIVQVKYVDKEEADDYMWNSRPISFMLDDGTRLVVQMDDEGNDGGALWYGTKDDQGILPVLGLED